MKNFFKIAFLGVIGLMALVFLTAEKPKKIVASEINTNTISYINLPSDYELVGQDNRVLKQTLFKENGKTLIVVGNHDSLSVVKDLPVFFDVTMPYVMVANISSAPWFVKKMFIPSKLEEINANSKIPMVYDFDGDMVKTLNVTNNAKTAFVAFLLEENGNIKKLYEGNVKEGALDGSMNEEEKKTILLPLMKLLN